MRIRSIRPEFWRSEDIKKHPREVRLLFVGLWSYVDDNGVGVDDFRQIASDLFPLEDDPVEVREFVRDGLARLSRGLQITRFEVDGKRFIYVPRWDVHQKIDRPGKERHLRPDNPVISGNPTFKIGHPDDSRDSRDGLDAGEGEKGRRGEGEKRLGDRSATADAEPDLFDAFWSNYPRKDGKVAARKAWPKACKRLSPERLVKAAEVWAGWWAEVGKDREHIPHASTWLNGDRWNDERPTPPARAAPTQNSTDAHFAALLSRQRPEDGPQLLALPGGAS